MKFNTPFRLPLIVLKKAGARIFLFIRKIRESANANLEKGANCSIHHSAILSTVGFGVIRFLGNNYIGRNVEIGTEGTVVLGKFTSIQDRCILLGDVEIGSHCVFAPNVYVSSGRHYYNYLPEFYIQDQDKMVHADLDLKNAHSKKVIIEDDCWIGINAVIMAGITVGKGSVIGANAVVTKDIEPYSVVVGSPAKSIRKRLDFYPPQKLTYDNDKDLPYFYSGFFTNKTNIDLDRLQGGIAVSRKFVVCADSGKSKQLILNLKKNAQGPVALSYNDQTMIITGGEFEQVSFNIAHELYHQFSIQPIDSDLIKIEKLAYIKQILIN